MITEESEDPRFDAPFVDVDGRLFQPTHQSFFSEDAQDAAVTFTLESGAYLVQSNMGGSEYPSRKYNFQY